MENNKRKVLSEEERKMMAMSMGLITGLISKFIMEDQGYDVDYKINGIPIDDVDKFNKLGLKEQLSLALKEERFEDCIILRDKIKNLC